MSIKGNMVSDKKHLGKKGQLFNHNQTDNNQLQTGSIIDFKTNFLNADEEFFTTFLRNTIN